MNDDEVRLAQDAIARNDFVQAHHHINNLVLDGHHQGQVSELTRRLFARENSIGKRSINRLGYGITIAVCGYAILSFQSPAGWGPVAWGLVAFLILPVLVGTLTGNSIFDHPDQPQISARFWRAFGIVSGAMAVYTLVGLTLTRSKMQSADKALDPAIFLFVILVYAAVAGTVAGFAGTTFRVRAKKS